MATIDRHLASDTTIEKAKAALLESMARNGGTHPKTLESMAELSGALLEHDEMPRALNVVARGLQLCAACGSTPGAAALLQAYHRILRQAGNAHDAGHVLTALWSVRAQRADLN